MKQSQVKSNLGENQEISDKKLAKEAKKLDQKDHVFSGFPSKHYIECSEIIDDSESYYMPEGVYKIVRQILRQTLPFGRESWTFKVRDFIDGIRYRPEKILEKGRVYYYRGSGLGRTTILKNIQIAENMGYIWRKFFCGHCRGQIKKGIKEMESRKGKAFYQQVFPKNCTHCHKPLAKHIITEAGLNFLYNATKEIFRKTTRSKSEPTPRSKSEPTPRSKSELFPNHLTPLSSSSHKNSFPQEEGDSKKPVDDDENKKPEEKTSQSQAGDYGRSSHNQNARDAHTLTDQAERVVKKFRQAFSQRRGLRRCVAELNEMVGIFGEQAFLDKIEKVVELEIKPSSMKYIMTCVMRNWDGTCPRCSGLGMNNTTPDGKCPLCRGQRHFSEYSELKRACSKMAK